MRWWIVLTFRLGKCSACGRTKPLKGTKNKRCYDCTLSGFTKKSKNIPWKQKESIDWTKLPDGVVINDKMTKEEVNKIFGVDMDGN